MPRKPDLVSDEEMLRDFKLALHQSLKAGKINGIALVNGLKAIQAMIPPAPPPEPEDSGRFSVLDQLGSLPKAEGRRLVRTEIVRLRGELALLDAALKPERTVDGEDSDLES